MQETLGRIAALSVCFSPATVKGEAKFGVIRKCRVQRRIHQMGTAYATYTCTLTVMRILQALAFGTIYTSLFL